jgi:hypothetical protein
VSKMMTMTLHDGESGNFLQRACVGIVSGFTVMPSYRHKEKRTRHTGAADFRAQVQALIAFYAGQGRSGEDERGANVSNVRDGGAMTISTEPCSKPGWALSHRVSLRGGHAERSVL